MVKVKILNDCSLACRYYAGNTVDVTDDDAKILIGQGVAISQVTTSKPKPEKKPKGK